ncbi:MAG: hypothetical protein E7047_07795 [Lentisphaerae bacterium]|nr:hypothetical protein [Lentisphaerota bacterium]
MSCTPNIPAIKRLGTIDRDIVEANYIVFKNELYLFEGIRYQAFSHPYYANDRKSCYCRLRRMRDHKIVSEFGYGLHMPQAFVFNDKLYVSGVDDHKTVRHYLYMIESEDLVNWSEKRLIFGGDSWRIHNSAYCLKPDGTVLLGMECDHPAGLFATFFAGSSDMKTFELLPDAVHGPGYTGGPVFRWFGEYCFIFYIRGSYESSFTMQAARSKDLKHWEESPCNPFMVPDAADRIIHARALDAENLRCKVNAAKNINVSDIDFCEYNGKLVMNYSWGDQKGTEFLALAEVDCASEREFCESFFA